MSETHPPEMHGQELWDHLETEHLDDEEAMAYWATQGNTAQPSEVVDLSEEITAVSDAFNVHTRRCPDCHPPMTLCPQGLGLEHALHSLAALRLRFETAELKRRRTT
jgi:hypothetical protein